MNKLNQESLNRAKELIYNGYALVSVIPSNDNPNLCYLRASDDDIKLVYGKELASEKARKIQEEIFESSLTKTSKKFVEEQRNANPNLSKIYVEDSHVLDEIFKLLTVAQVTTPADVKVVFADYKKQQYDYDGGMSI